MGRISITSVIVILAIAALYCSTFSESSHLRNRRNAFILRKCIASAELHRRTGSHSIRDPIAKDAINETQKVNHTDSMRDNRNITFESNWQRMPYQVLKNERKDENPVVYSKNTPLTTVDIKSLRNRLPAFRKKSLLPELRRSVSSRTVGPSQNIILIKPVN